VGGDAAGWGWLEERQRFGVLPGLERTRALLSLLGNPERRVEVVLVAGTNGKGSVTALLHAMLRAAGVAAGRFTSPHLERFEERIVIAGDASDERLLAASAERVREHVEASSATYFEVLTALALDTFAAAGVVTAVLEAGMGGRWDATNATEPAISLITSVDLDHVEVLGATVEAIAADKAGVARSGRLLLCGASGAALDVVRREADAVGAPLWALDDADPSSEDLAWEGVRVRVTVPGGATWTLATPLLGAHQARNLALAGAAAAALGLSEGAARAGALDVRWPGRLEPLAALRRRWLLDGAHNPAGAQALARALQVLAPTRAAALIMGVSADKDVAGMVGALRGTAQRVIATRSRASARALAPDDLAARWRASATTMPISVAEGPAEAIRAGVAATRQGDLLVVAGSLFLVGEARTLLRGEQPPDGPRWQ
jgi:dihydrofolate synthase / folylpolyglutamate synthase